VTGRRGAAEAVTTGSGEVWRTTRVRVAIGAALAATVMIGCATAEGARRHTPRVEQGRASYYGRGFAGRRTASGERFDPRAMTAAHPSLPFGTRVRVTRTNGASVTVRVNDRCGCPNGRIIDLSEEAARRLGMIKEGTANVRVEVLDSEKNH